MTAQSASRWQRSVVALGLLAMVLVFMARAALAAPDATIVVTPSNLNGWLVGPETGAPTINFEAGPATPPLGTGSLQAILAAPTDGGGAFLLDLYEGLRLDQITTLEYATYVTTSQGAQAFALQFEVDDNLSDANTAFMGRLVYEPYLNNGGTVPTGLWQTWDALDGGNARWWSTPNANTTLDDTCPQASPCTLTTILSAFPNVGIRTVPTPNATLILKAGSGYTSFEGNADALTLVTNTAINDTYDFDPNPACTTTCYVNGTTGNDANGGASASDAKRTIQAAVNQVSVGGTVIVAAGTYNENVTLTKNGLTLSGAGAGSNPAVHTIVDGNTPANIGTTPGIRLQTGVTGLTIQDLRVQDFGAASGIFGANGNNNLTIQRVHVYNNTAGSGLGGLYINGPISNVLINQVEAVGNSSRGIVIWNGFKQNITITNNLVTNNNCCGIELQDGTASGVTITGNTIQNNSDNGIGVVGLTSGAGANLIANNTLTDNGRFGIEIKLPNGTGATTGDGSIVVENNSVTRTFVPSDARDLAGIAAFRRGYVVGNNNVDIPTGVVIRNNTVTGYQQTSTSDGFGIVVEGTAMTVTGNTLTNNDVGIQRQAGHLPYTPNTNVDGDQSNLADQYFGRGNSPVVCATIGPNTFSGNGANLRDVGPVGSPTITNVNTTEVFCTIQAAIDDANTVAGNTIQIAAGTYNISSTILVNKPLTLQGAQVGVDPRPSQGSLRVPGSASETIVDGNGTNILLRIDANDVTLDGLEFVDGAGDLIESLSTAPVKFRPALRNLIVHAASTDEAIQLRNVNDAVVERNFVYDTQGDGIELSLSSNAGASVIRQNEVRDARSEFGGIYVYATNQMSVTQNLLINNSSGISVGRSTTNAAPNTVVSNNVISGTTGIFGPNSSGWGIRIYNSDNAIVAGNVISDAIGSTTDGSLRSSIWVRDGSDTVTVRANSITRSDVTRTGIFVDGTSTATIGGATDADNNTISGFDTGIVTNSPAMTISHNNQTIVDNDTGVEVRAGSATITFNDIRENRVGVLVSGGTATINNNSIVDNTDFGVENTTLVIVNALSNFWGDPTGPLDNTPVPDACGLTLTNPGSTGDRVTQCVQWATPLDVLLASFAAEAQADHIRVTWETVSELTNVGFNLFRSTDPAAPTEQLNSALIPSQAPGSSQGFLYEWQDATVAAGVTYFYWLEDVDVTGVATLHGPVSATLQPPTAVRLASLGSANAAPLAPWLALGPLGLVVAAWAWRRRA